jgi:hypothetical protein
MWAPMLGAAIAVMLLAVDFLAFHDVTEEHTLRDWLTLFASLLVFIYLAKDLLTSYQLRSRGR